jgi:hypothetical protein
LKVSVLSQSLNTLFQSLALNQNTPYYKHESGCEEKVNRKNLAIGTTVILVFSITLMTFLTTSYTALRAINPTAALTAITMAIVGIAWFNKTSN